MKVRIVIHGSSLQEVGYRLFLLEKAGALDGFQAVNTREGLTVTVEGGEKQVNDFIRTVKEERPPDARVSSVKTEKYVGSVIRLADFRSQFSVEQLAKIAITGVEMKGDIKEMKGDVKEMKGDVKEMKGDVKEMKGDIKEVKGDIKEMKGDIKEVKGDIKEMKGDVKEVKGDVKEVKGDLKEMKDDIKEIKDNTEATKEGMKTMLSKQDETTSEIRGLRSDLRTWMDDRFTRLESDVRAIKEKVGLA